MSMELHVFLAGARLPDVRGWQESLDELGFDVRLDPSLEVRSNSGFVPAAFRGRSGGFEFDVLRAADVVDGDPELADRLTERDVAATFRWGGTLDEAACAVAAAAALASATYGVWFDPQEGECLDLPGAIHEARSVIEAAD